MKVLIFGLTGLCNEVIKALIKTNHEIMGVITKFDNKFFPYYQEDCLEIFLNKNGLPIYYDLPNVINKINYEVDLILVCGFHRKIEKYIYSQAKYAVNFHPSLLPNYKGPNPYYWVIRNGESCTGITVHQLTDSIDCGDIYIQRKCIISANENQGSLRKKLAQLSYIAAKELLGKVESSDLTPKIF
jgi:methionyl-tRNA formyltransferase